jgi:hypothetical protein
LPTPRTLAGAVIGVVIAAWAKAGDQPVPDCLALMDASLAQPEAGLPL